MSKKGQILIVSLWILAILAVLVLGLARRASIVLRLARYQRDRLKAWCVAYSGVNEVIARIKKDNNVYDALDEPWAVSGVEDEESRIDINKADKKLLEELFLRRDLEADASGLSTAVVEWISPNTEEDEAKKIFKNAPLKSPEEMLFILEYFYHDKQRSQEAYDKIKGLISVCRADKVNINTVGEDVLIILLRGLSQSDSEKSNAEKIAAQVLSLRDAQGHFAFREDLDIDFITADETNLFNRLLDNVSFKSANFSIESSAEIANSMRKIKAVYNRENNKIAYWRQN